MLFFFFFLTFFKILNFTNIFLVDKYSSIQFLQNVVFKLATMLSSCATFTSYIN